ncbi:heavy-metal-associated domain-containing protein [Flavisericum labens]|uniref:heavy-metal-associated domain-containing protein n=1 Tax=Flavisericum labens TaxID=3377112 RepID=UPI00387B7080
MKTTLEIQNLKCGGCAKTIAEGLTHLKGVNDIVVNVENSSVTFSSKDGMSKLPEVKTLLLKLGYPVKVDKNVLTTKAKSFVSCAVGKIST